jgi:signal transduction histidine kinase
MLRAANYVVRVLVLALVGGIVFTQPWPGQLDVGIQIVALSVSGVLLIFVVPADRSVHLNLHNTSVWVNAALMFFACLGCATPEGGIFSLFCTAAAISAGSSLDLGPGLAIIALGAVTLDVPGALLRTNMGALIEYPLLLPLAFVFGRNLYAQRLYASQSKDLLEQAELLHEEQTKAATLDERARIAREIHDVLAHSLGALGLQIQVARAVLTDTADVDRAVELLDHAQRMATDGLTETRRAVHALRGDTLPLAEGLAELSEDHQRRHGSRVQFEVLGEPRPLSPDAGLAISRTAQEALVNTAKHAPRQPIRMALDFECSVTSLVVSNPLPDDRDLASRDELATVNGGYGLTGMRERLLLLDGTLRAGRQGQDWVVVATVPQ